jgi:hypothetical protein
MTGGLHVSNVIYLDGELAGSLEKTVASHTRSPSFPIVKQGKKAKDDRR